MKRFAHGAVALALAIGALSGCSSNTCRVTGTLVKNGKAVTVEEGQWVQLILYPIEKEKPSGEWFPANVNPDGTFEVPGKEGDGVPPGKYRFGINWVTFKDRGHDFLKHAFARDTSPIVEEIDGSRNLTIDLAAADSARNPSRKPIRRRRSCGGRWDPSRIDAR